LKENDIEKDRETDGKSYLTIDLLTGLKHSVLVKEEAYKMYLYRGADKSLARPIAKISWKSSCLDFLGSRRQPPH
jgi:hypothetical protein